MNELAIGKVRTSTGVKGFFKVLSFSGEYKHFLALKGTEVSFRLGERSRLYRIEEVRMSGGNVVMKAEGIDTPEDAKLLSGWEIYVERGKASALDNGEYYIADLCGLQMVFEGEVIGRVLAMFEGPQSDILEVETQDGVRLIPFMDRFIGEVSLEKGTIELTEGWLLT